MKIVCVLFAGLLALVSASALAQDATGVIAGRGVDRSGRARHAIPFVTPGAYTIDGMRDGFEAIHRTEDQVDAGDLVVDLVFDAGVSAATETRMIDEAARIWAPYGVALRAAPVVDSDPNAVTLHVAVVDRPAGDVNDRALGSIQFREAVPDPTISLYAGTVSELVSSAAAGSISHWPPAFHDAVVERVLGRALAHEIGHYLLRTRSHSASGLMRATQPIFELMESNDRKLVLSAEQQCALRDAILVGSMFDHAPSGGNESARSASTTASRHPGAHVTGHAAYRAPSRTASR